MTAARGMLVAAIAVFGSACPRGPAAVETCTEIGQQCRLDEGLLGVCAPAEGANCEHPPCLACTPQH